MAGVAPSALPALDLHLIGPLQSNKVADAVATFDTIETVDRPKIVIALAEGGAEGRALPAAVRQINTGVGAAEGWCVAAGRGRLHRELSGPARAGDRWPDVHSVPIAEQASPHFALLAKIAARNGIANLSMGMSADFALAIPLGATHVRVGSAIFGTR